MNRCLKLITLQICVVLLLIFSGCEKQESSPSMEVSSTEPGSKQQVVVDDNAAKEKIESLLGMELPTSAGNCKYHSISYGLARGGVGYGYFEINRTYIQSLLDGSDNFPDSSELGENQIAKENVEKAIEQWQKFTATSDNEKNMKESAEILKDWWKPLELSQRQYASYEKFGNSPMPHGPQMDICVGQIKDDLMGFYFVYHTD